MPPPEPVRPRFEAALALHRQGQFAEAEAIYRAIVEKNPRHFDALNMLGALALQTNRMTEAVALLRDAIKLNPRSSIGHGNLGFGLYRLGAMEESLHHYDRAVAIDPRFIDGWSNRGNVLKGLNRHREAIASYDKALALKPDLASARWNRSVAHLALGEYEIGWREHEWRKRLVPPIALRPYPQPPWTGAEPIAGKTVYLYWEQGFGDTIHFSRYARLVQEKGAQVILSVPDSLVELMRSLHPGIEVIGGVMMPAHFDYHAPLMSLPLAFRTTYDTIPGMPGYLRASRDRAAFWSDRVAELRGLKAGLVSMSGAVPKADDHDPLSDGRTLPLAACAPLGDVPGVSFVSLQKTMLSLPPEALAPPPGLILHDWTEDLSDFNETAALIEALDLVITVDTSVAHLAGALGKPVWILLRFGPCWRWSLDRADCPWYPSARLFRQPSWGDWTSVIADVRKALHERAA